MYSYCVDLHSHTERSVCLSAHAFDSFRCSQRFPPLGSTADVRVADSCKLHNRMRLIFFRSCSKRSWTLTIQNQTKVTYSFCVEVHSLTLLMLGECVCERERKRERFVRYLCFILGFCVCVWMLFIRTMFSVMRWQRFSSRWNGKIQNEC